MIPRITRGTSARAALAYDYGPGRREEHVNARQVAGSVPGTWRDQASMIDETLALRPAITQGVWRTSLRAAPEDPVLTDAVWGRIAEQYVAAMGLTKTPWTATRHGDDHIHLTVSRVTWEGKVLALSHDFAKAQAACRAIEREHHLVDASARFDRTRPQVSHGERESAARRGVDAERVQLRELVATATNKAAAAGGSRDAFEAQLDAAGVAWRANVASTGRVSGYSYALAGHTDPTGVPVFFKGSQLGKAHTWAATSTALTAGHEALREQVRAEVRQEAQQRRERREQQQAAMLAEHREVVAQRRDLAAAVNDARRAHSASADALAVAGRVLQVAAAGSRTAHSDAEDALRDLQRALSALADLTQTLAQRSLAARARERLAAPRTGPVRRAATLTGAQDAVTAARDRVAATGEVTSARQAAHRDAAGALQAAREEHEHTGAALHQARGQEMRAMRPTAWEAAQHAARVQAAQENARSLSVSPSYQPPPPTPGRGLGR